MINRLGLPLLVSVVQLCAAVLALGRPDLGAAGAFLRGTWPTTLETLAALQLLVWAIVLAAVAWSLGTLALELAQRAAAGRRFREGAALATGLLILTMGGVHHLTSPMEMSGGSVQEAQGALGR